MEILHMSRKPLISVCIPCYNAENYVAETIDRLLKQTYSNTEIILVDDFSTDNTWKTINQLSGGTIKVLRHQSNRGAAAARNEAYKNSSGEYILFLDADDLLNQHFLESQFDNLPDTCSVSVSSWGRFYNNDLSTFLTDPHIIPQDMDVHEWVIRYWTQNRHTTPPGRILIPRKIAEQAGPWNERLSLNDDFEYFTRIFLAAEKIRFNPEAELYYRSGIGGLSSRKTDHAYLSNYLSISLSISRVLERFGNDRDIEKACANILQSFIYESYPALPNYRTVANWKIDYIGGSDYPFPAGGYTQSLLKLIGWKLTKKIKLALNKRNEKTITSG